MQILMRIAFKRILFLFAFLSIFNFSSGQTLNEYIDLLKSGSKALAQSNNYIQASQQDVLLSKSALLPSVGLVFNYQRDFTKNFLFINDEETAAFFGDSFRTNFNNNVTLDVVAGQPIYDPGARASHKLAKLAVEASQLSNDDLSNELVYQATQLYWQALFTRESLKVLEENQNLAKDQWKQMKELFDEGYVSELQVRQSESYYKRTVPQLNSAKNNYQMLLNELKALASLPIEYELDLKGDLLIATDEMNAYVLSEVNLSNNTKLKLLNQQLDIADQQINVSKAAKYPVIKANLGYNLSVQDDGFSFDNNINLVYGQIGVEMPIYTGGANNAQIQKSIINQEIAQLEIEQARLDLEKERHNAKLNFQDALDKIEQEKDAIELSVIELTIAEEGVKLGTVTPLELKEIRVGLTGGKLRLLNASLDLRIALLEMERIQGI